MNADLAPISALPLDGDMDRWIALPRSAQHSPELGRAAVAEDSAIAASKYGGHPSSFVAESSVPDGVHPAMNSVQATGAYAIADGAVGKPQAPQLFHGDHAVLPCR